MKKVKIMLMSIAVLAVVGGALAFKAKFINPFCTTDAYTTLGGVWTCPDTEDITTCPLAFYTTDNPTTTVCYTIPEPFITCDGVTDCVATTVVASDL